MMHSKIMTGTRKIQGTTLFTLKFECEMESAVFRDNIANMIVAALGGATVGEPEEKTPALGFHKEDETDD
jgi:hypothetical protein